MNFERISRGTRRRVLVVDDDRETRDMFRTALRIAGFEVRLASDGVHALSHIDQQPPDVVVLDLDLPLLNGIAVHGELAAGEHTREVPVVIVTGTDWQSPYPAFVTLRKPVALDRLINVITKAVSSAGSAGLSYS